MSTKIANPDALGDTLDAIEEKRQSRKDERLELQGTARDLFVARYEDTFEIEVHGNGIEFYRPMSARDVELTDVDEETRERIEHGAALLDDLRLGSIDSCRRRSLTTCRSTTSSTSRQVVSS